MANSPASETRRVPKAALAFAVGPMQFAAKGDDGTTPVTIRARSGEPLVHWFWGKTVHDMAGFRAAAPKVPLDYCHNDAEVIGLLDGFKPSNEGLDCTGRVVPFTETDRASEVIHKSGKGVPYQASIYFDLDTLVIEQVGQGAKAQVNGYELEGPAIIFRQWMLRGVAACPYGYDVNTSTRLSAGSLAGEVDLSITLLSAPEATMDKQTNPPPVTKPAETPPTELTNKPAESAPAVPAPVDPRAEFKATLAKFSEKFGPANGAAWAAEGLSYEAALEKHAVELATQLAAEKTKNTDLAAKLAAVPRGEKDPVSFGTNEEHEAGGATPKTNNGLGNLAAFAAGLKLPSSVGKK